MATLFCTWACEQSHGMPMIIQNSSSGGFRPVPTPGKHSVTWVNRLVTRMNRPLPALHHHAAAACLWDGHASVVHFTAAAFSTLMGCVPLMCWMAVRGRNAIGA